MSDIILHITTRGEWQAAQKDGQYIAPSLSAQGFIHCSTPSQAVPVAEKFYKDQPGLVLLVIDPQKLASNLKWEPPSDGAPPAGVPENNLFPHVYGSINLQAVVQAVKFEKDRAGKLYLPPLIRPARDEDADLAVSILRSSMGELTDYLFGDKTHPAEKYLARLYKTDGHRFSRRYSWVLEDKDKAVGFLLCFPGRKINRLQAALFAKLFSVYGLASTVRMIGRMLPLINVLETKADEYYISNVGVSPAFRGCGYGTRLMAFAEEQACKAGIKKCSLTVDVQNVGAIRLYERLGYKIVSTHHFSGKVAERENGMHRMIKELS